MLVVETEEDRYVVAAVGLLAIGVVQDAPRVIHRAERVGPDERAGGGLLGVRVSLDAEQVVAGRCATATYDGRARGPRVAFVGVSHPEGSGGGGEGFADLVFGDCTGGEAEGMERRVFVTVDNFFFIL
jgi:hypothetical protein